MFLKMSNQKNNTLEFVLPVTMKLWMVAFTCLLVGAQFVIGARYEPVAQMVGIMDSQSRTLNTTYLDYEEQNAILRSSKFLVNERAAGFVASPSKVLYVNPGATVVSSNE